MKIIFGVDCGIPFEADGGGIGGDLFHAVHLHSVGAHRVSDQAEEWRAVLWLVDQGMEASAGREPSQAQLAITRT